MRIARLRADRRGTQADLCAVIVCRQCRNIEIRIAHETMPAGALGADDARLQVLRVTVEVVARIGDAAGKRHHDREARTRPADDFGGVAVAVGEVVHDALERHFETEQGRAMPCNAHAPVTTAIGQHHDGLVAQLGPFGAVVGSIRTQQSTARVLLTLVNVRTTEQEYVAEGTASKTDISFAGGGFGGMLGGLGGGYSNTPIGQVIAQAYLTAFTNLVGYMRTAQPGQAAAAAPSQSYMVKSPIQMRVSPAPSAKAVRSFNAGDTVYPTGQKNGIWWEVDDETGNRGWVTSVQLGPK